MNLDSGKQRFVHHDQQMVCGGVGKGTVSYMVEANTDNTALTGSITVAGETFTVTQAGK